jgi:hypothetical protein
LREAAFHAPEDSITLSPETMKPDPSILVQFKQAVSNFFDPASRRKKGLSPHL